MQVGVNACSYNAQPDRMQREWIVCNCMTFVFMNLLRLPIPRSNGNAFLLNKVLGRTPWTANMHGVSILDTDRSLNPTRGNNVNIIDKEIVLIYAAFITI